MIFWLSHILIDLIFNVLYYVKYFSIVFIQVILIVCCFIPRLCHCNVNIAKFWSISFWLFCSMTRFIFYGSITAPCICFSRSLWDFSGYLRKFFVGFRYRGFFTKWFFWFISLILGSSLISAWFIVIDVSLGFRTMMSCRLETTWFFLIVPKVARPEMWGFVWLLTYSSRMYFHVLL